MPLVQFNQKQIKLAKVEVPRKISNSRKRKVFKCRIDGYNLYIGKYKVSKTWAIKFAKWILQSFDK